MNIPAAIIGWLFLIGMICSMAMGEFVAPLQAYGLCTIAFFILMTIRLKYENDEAPLKSVVVSSGIVSFFWIFILIAPKSWSIKVADIVGSKLKLKKKKGEEQ